MTCLQTLWLARNRLRSLEGLAWASQLRMLFVQSNQLLCLEPSLRQLQSLQVLDVSCNLLQNLDDCLATLKSLRNLSDLMLQDNPCYREDICVPQPASVQPSRSAPLAYSAWKIPPPAGCKEAIKAAALGRSMDASALKLTQHGRICSDDYVAKDVWKYCGQQNAATDLLGTARARLSMRI
ncbi:hypothetical protein WJX84_012028 [Apatococcus fuscideae]|uniref:Uncharacterized protein n=1 Tax=Apatococcus fuscideae TaxID=2026836 RepID=A0AAW1TI68_9CHLO